MCIIKNLFISIIILPLLYQPVLCLDINLAQTQILATEDVYRIKLKPQGQNSPFTLQYYLLPSQWRQTDKYIIIPKIKSEIWKQYLVSVVLRDRLNNQYRVSIMFLLNNKTLIMDTTAYDFFTSSNSLGLDNINPQNFVKLIEQQNNIKPTREVLDKSKSEKLPNLILQDVFTNTLNPKLIKQLLFSGHLPAVIKQIFDLQKKNLNCIQNLAYYQQISTLAKQVLAQKLKKIQQYQSQFFQKRGNLVLGKPILDPIITPEQLKQLQRKQIKRKKDYYSIVQQYIQRLKAYENIKQNMKNLEDDIIQVQSKRDRLAQKLQKQQNNRLKLQLLNTKGNNPTINAKLNSAKKGLTILKKQFNKLELQIDLMIKSQQSLADSINLIQKQNNNFQLSIDSIQRQLSQINLQLYIIRSNQPPPLNTFPSNFLQVQPQILSTQKSAPVALLHVPSQVSSLSAQVEEYFKTMPIGYNLIVKNRYFLNLRTVGQLSSISDASRQLMVIELIKRYLDSFIDKQYYSCYGVKNFRQKNQQGLYIYKIPYTQFISYLNKFYLNNLNNKYLLSQNSLPMQRILLRRANIIPTIITKRFSDVFNSIQTQNEIKIQELKDRLSCRSAQPLQSFVGVIKSIKDNIYEVKVPPLQTYYVIKGICTRVEVSGAESAEKLLLWRGVKLSDKVYNAYFILIM